VLCVFMLYVGMCVRYVCARLRVCVCVCVFMCVAESLCLRCWGCLRFIEIIEMRRIKLEFRIIVRTTAIAIAVCVVFIVFIVFK